MLLFSSAKIALLLSISGQSCGAHGCTHTDTDLRRLALRLLLQLPSAEADPGRLLRILIKGMTQKLFNLIERVCQFGVPDSIGILTPAIFDSLCEPAHLDTSTGYRRYDI